VPGGTDTNFGDGMHRGRWENSPQSTPEEVAVSGLNALDENASYRVVGAAKLCRHAGVAPAAARHSGSPDRFPVPSVTTPEDAEDVRQAAYFTCRGHGCCGCGYGGAAGAGIS
jgi:hypothetical protein